MAFARMFNTPNVTKETYDAIREKLGVTQDNMPDGASSTLPVRVRTAAGASSRYGNRTGTLALGTRGSSLFSQRKGSVDRRPKYGRCTIS